VRPLIRLLPSLDSSWRLVIGAASDDVVDDARVLAAGLGVADAVQTLGFVDEDALDLEFARASVVVRWRPEGWISGSADYAVSGPLIRALGRGCAVVTNDRRGAAECLDAAGAVVVSNGEEGLSEMIAAVSRLVRDAELRRELAHAGLAHIAADHTPDAVARRLAGAIR
jgi:glycosyltransferase involved in cell wall biosynthesis